MASLKEVKNRISSVKSTRQITSAMKMVASAKLHKAQGRIENMLPYQRKLNEILTNFFKHRCLVRIALYRSAPCSSGCHCGIFVQYFAVWCFQLQRR